MRLYTPSGQQASNFYTKVVTKALETNPAIIQKAAEELTSFASLTKSHEARTFLTDPTVSVKTLKDLVKLAATKGGYNPVTVQLLGMFPLHSSICIALLNMNV